MGPLVYLDNNATTRPTEDVAAAMRDALDQHWGNPSSAHLAGRGAKRIIETARDEVALLLGAGSSDEIVFTSGGTEADNWAMAAALAARPGPSGVVITAVEHEAVIRAGERAEAAGHRLSVIEVDSEGMLDLDGLRRALSGETAVVSVMLANNETGVVFPVAQIAEMVKENSNAIFHVDGVNAAGKIPIDLKDTAIDLFSISAHKFHGPKGIGALYVRRGVDIGSLLIGGGQEAGRRAGTEPVHQIAALGAAARSASDLSPMTRVRELRDRLEQAILEAIPYASRNGTSDPARRLPNTSSLCFENVNGEMILSRLDDAGICVSTGSACNAGSKKVSHVLKAMDIPFSRAMGSIRFSLSRMTTQDEINFAIEKVCEVVEDLRPGARAQT